MTTALTPQFLDPALLGRVTSRVAENTTIAGSIKCAGKQNVGLRIDGEVLGDIVLGEGSVVHIGPTGRVKGAVLEADFVFLEGTLHASSTVRQVIELAASSTVRGKTSYKQKLGITPGAKVIGEIAFAE
jgi:cytoskeletal protein CcmA (bactofilin family)